MATINKQLAALRRPPPRSLTRTFSNAETGTEVTLTLRSLDGLERMAVARRGRELVKEWGSEQRNPGARWLTLPVAGEDGNPVVIEPDDEFLYAAAVFEAMEVVEAGAVPWGPDIWAAIALTEPDIWQGANAMVQELLPVTDPETAKNSTGVETTGSASAPPSAGLTSSTPNSSEASSSSSPTSAPASGTPTLSSERLPNGSAEPAPFLARVIASPHPLMSDG